MSADDSRLFFTNELSAAVYFEDVFIRFRNLKIRPTGVLERERDEEGEVAL